MTLIDNPQTLPEIQAAFARVDAEATRTFENIPADAFFAHPPQVWSPAENVVHLAKSVKPFAQAMRLPKLIPQVLFGTAHKAKSFAELVAEYRAALDAGATAPAAFVPELEIPRGDLSEAKADVMRRWCAQNDKLAAALPNWSEADLDRFQLPHPLLGKLTVREMLFFTVYHNLHHLNDVRALLGETKLEA